METAIEAVRIHAQVLSLWLHHEWKRPDANLEVVPPWVGKIRDADGSAHRYLIRKIRLDGCESGHIELPGGRIVPAVTCFESDILVVGNDFQVRSRKPQGVTPGHIESSLFLVRVNTDSFKDPNALQWRIMKQQGSGEFTERLAARFRIAGQCFGKRHDILEAGELVRKMHIAGFGNATWEGDDVVIWGRA